jgi:hypothetical protein
MLEKLDEIDLRIPLDAPDERWSAAGETNTLLVTVIPCLVKYA